MHACSEKPPRARKAKNEGRQELDPVDRVMWCVDRALRGMGYPGFQTQMLVWLAGRADAKGLRNGLAELSRREPVIASRLTESGKDDDAEAYWSFRSDGVCPLEETQLPSADREAVLDHAAKLLSTANDPARTNPMAFHLLHRPDGRDVFLMQYNHMLTDNGAIPRLLRWIDRLSAGDDGEQDAEAHPRNLIRRSLRRVRYSKRCTAALEAVNLQGRLLRGRAAVLGNAEEDAPRNIALRIATRSLESEATSALRARVVELCGFPSLSMAVLASVFRAIDRLAPQQARPGPEFRGGHRPRPEPAKPTVDLPREPDVSRADQRPGGYAG